MKRRIYDDELHAQFVTFSCYRRRRLLDHPGARQIVVDMLAGELPVHEGVCSGFVVMPDHIHAIAWFPVPKRLSRFMKQWMQKSSVKLKKFLRGQLPHYAGTFDTQQPAWQARTSHPWHRTGSHAHPRWPESPGYIGQRPPPRHRRKRR